VSTYTLGGEPQILDRVNRWASFPTEQLRAIISADGITSERGEASRRILESRGEAVPTSATPAPIVIPTGSINVKLPSGMAPQFQLLPGKLDFSNPIVLGGIGLGVVLLGMLFRRGK